MKNQRIRFLIVFTLLFLSPSVLNAREAAVTKVDVLAQSETSWDGNKLPRYGEGPAEVTILRIVIPPGTQLPEHRHPVINAGALMKGELTVVTDKGKVLHLKEGESIVEVVETWHYGKNEGDVPAELIMFYAGNKGVPLSVKQDSLKTGG
ncbi:cupin [Prosthecochloris sp. GSB1]|uniref:cupin domain-containing protein n=1 Tax=Prosthecochloris sp. GSB1 TaxID=281093 RepID=UPI000B8CF378|nr:cupin domain-containing protein [Prosthecochloris sp. GSB1]ASQ90342.1 cupin [Prosthecochloris sp. GSB1]